MMKENRQICRKFDSKISRIEGDTNLVVTEQKFLAFRKIWLELLQKVKENFLLED